MAEQPLTYPELTPDLQGGLSWRALKYFGAGAIVACVTIGSGETVFASRGGAIYGYTMLWCFVAGAICKGFLVYSGSRFITLTGCSPLQSWQSLPGLRGWFVPMVAVLTCICMPFWMAGLPGMLGDFSNWVVGIQNPVTAPGFAELTAEQQQAQIERYTTYGRYWATFYLCIAIAITWLQTYGFLERAQTVIVGLLLVCMIAAALVSRPDWRALLAGLFVPQLPDFEPWVKQKYADADFTQRSPWIEIMVYLGVIGGGAQDYFGYVGMLREKTWGLLGRRDLPQQTSPPAIAVTAENIRRGKRWLLPAQIDMGVATLAILVFTCCFVVLGANVLHPRQTVPNGFNLLTEQAEFLGVLVGESGLLSWLVDWIYKTGIFFAFFGTILGACEIFVRTVRECVVAIFPGLISTALSRFRCWVLLYAGGGGLLLMWFLKIDARLFVDPAALIGSGLVCGLWCFAILWSDRAHLAKPLRMPIPLLIGLFLSGLVLTVGPLIGLWEYFKNLGEMIGRS